MNYPKYWPENGWKQGWGKFADRDADNLGDAGEEAERAFYARVASTYGTSSGANFSVAELSLKTGMGAAIVEFVGKNLANKQVSLSVKSGTYQKIARDMKKGLDGVDKSDLRVANLNRIIKKDQSLTPQSTAATIKRIKVVRNPALWSQYWEAREEMKAAVRDQTDMLPFRSVQWVDAHLDTPVENAHLDLPVIDRQTGEMLLFHGTAKDTMKKIAGGGFATDVSKFRSAKSVMGRTDWGMLGMGTYFSDAMGKSMVYFLCQKHSTYHCPCTRQVILARVLVGRSLLRQKKTSFFSRRKNWLRADRHDEVAGKKIGPGIAGASYHSVIGRGDVERGFEASEVLVKKKEMMYPEFIIYYGIEDSPLSPTRAVVRH